jgi:hypothetical protein
VRGKETTSREGEERVCGRLYLFEAGNDVGQDTVAQLVDEVTQGLASDLTLVEDRAAQALNDDDVHHLREDACGRENVSVDERRRHNGVVDW